MTVLSVLKPTSRALLLGSSLFGLAISLNIVQTVSLLVAPFCKSIAIRLNSSVLGTLWSYMQFLFERTSRGKITFSGDHIPLNENAIVVSNHRSFTDFYLIHALAIRKRMLSNCKYFAKDSLKWIPFFGWGMWLANFILLRRNWVADQSKINQIFSSLKKFKPPVWIVSFIEGTRFTPEKHEKSMAFARERNLPMLKNLLLPRTKGFLTTVRALRDSHVKYLYDLTIAYNHHKKGFGVAPNLLRIHTDRLDKEYQFHVHVRRFPIESLPEEDEQLTEWVKNLFQEKDTYLEKLKEDWDTQVRVDEKSFGEIDFDNLRAAVLGG